MNRESYLLKPTFMDYNPEIQKPTTTMEHWLYMMKDIGSPLSFIIFPFIVMIGACLQRRVWMPFGPSTLYPNIFLILVAPPGVGKTRVLSEITKLMRYHFYLPDDKQKILDNLRGREGTETLVEEFLKREAVLHGLLFPSPADSTTLAALTQEMALPQTTHTGRFTDFKGKPNNLYMGASMISILEELSDLIRVDRDCGDLMRFLGRAWDCGDYRRKLKTGGEDLLRHISMTLMAGTNLEFMQSAFNNKVLAEGFAARTLFLYEDKERKREFVYGDLNPDQKASQQVILKRIKELSRVYGQLEMTPEAFAFMKEWYEVEENGFRTNSSRRLDYFFTRILVHLFKMTSALHFLDKNDGIITLDDLRQGLWLIDWAQNNMHVALETTAKNILYNIASDIRRFICRKNKVSRVQIEIEFYSDIQKQEDLTSALDYLIKSKQIKILHEGDGKKVMYGPYK